MGGPSAQPPTHRKPVQGEHPLVLAGVPEGGEGRAQWHSLMQGATGERLCW